MAALLRRPVVFMTGLYLGGNRYAIHFEPLADFSVVERGQRDAAVEAAITRYAALLDQYCRMAPYNWFNFFDFWQPAPTAMPQKS
jgi:predicted LPLAT superfamily acyltransferase